MLQDLIVAFARIELACQELDIVSAVVDTAECDERSVALLRDLKAYAVDYERVILARLGAEEA